MDQIEPEAQAVVLRRVLRGIRAEPGGLIRRDGPEVNVECRFYDQPIRHYRRGDPRYEGVQQSVQQLQSEDRHVAVLKLDHTS